MRPGYLKLLFFIGLLFIGTRTRSQNNFYDIGKIQKIEIQFSQANWDYILDTNKLGSDSYILANTVKINGVTLDSIGIKYKGSSSYDSTFKKNPLHIKLDKFKSNSYLGITDIKLANSYSDPSMIREALSYNILNKYMHSPRSNFAMVFINGIYYGLYSNDEPIGKTFASEHFYGNSTNTMFKCSQEVASPYAKSSLKYISSDSSDYFPRFEIESKSGWNDLVKLCDTVTNFTSRIPANIDVDRFLWMFAFNNVMVNMDSYSGAFSQNYYIYKDNTGHYDPIAWDLNMSFGAFPFVGSQSGGLGTLSVAQMQSLSAMLHSTDADWPLMNYLLSDVSSRKRYLAHVKTILNENFVNSSYETIAGQMQTLIDSAVNADPFKFFSYAQFQNGMTGNVIFSSRTIPGIKNLMEARKTALLTNDLTGTQPSISNNSASVLNPAVGKTFTIKSSVNNALVVYLYYRFDQGLKFSKIQMFDDGAHNDGTANDKVYAIDIVMSSGLCQYYIYAESSDAAALSPERAEHEFYSVSSTVTKVNKGDVVINEFMASNVAFIKDTAGGYDDWIELYNNTPNPVNLTGWFLTDDFSNKTKWQFTNGTTLGAYSYMIVWCDNEPSQAGVHSTFKLSNNGESIMLSQADTSLVDSISFGAQKSDTSFARIPNATGPFQFRLPTFNYRNDTSGVGINYKEVQKNNTRIIPNPGNGIFNILNPLEVSVSVLDLGGKLILESRSKTINLRNYEPGIYIFKILDEDNKVETLRVGLVR